MARRPKCWSWATGDRGSQVAVFEREPGGVLYARAFDPVLRLYRRVSLRHRDRELAKTYALTEAGKLREGRAELLMGRVTLARVLGQYLAFRSPRKSATEQESDKRRTALWRGVLGSQKDPHLITLAEWERFCDLRASGAITATGEPVPEDKRKTVRPRTVQHDCLWLRFALNWATKWRSSEGHYLMRENPVRGFDAPEDKNPRRPVATTDRYEALRVVSDRVDMEIRWDGKREHQRSYLSELLDLAYGTGRRISAICALRYEDLRLDVKPHGAIRWPAATDKQGRETVAPVSPTVRAALDRVLRQRPGIGAAYLFPSPETADQPVTKERAGTWLRKAEKLAELPKQDGSLWHAYRRAWATARKHLSLKDTAAAGGWACTETLLRCYQQPDDATMLAVVMGGAELRERKAQ